MRYDFSRTTPPFFNPITTIMGWLRGRKVEKVEREGKEISEVEYLNVTGLLSQLYSYD